jgi:hypothetical protein
MAALACRPGAIQYFLDLNAQPNVAAKNENVQSPWSNLTPKEIAQKVKCGAAVDMLESLKSDR